jgi:hypothetical protein
MSLKKPEYTAGFKTVNGKKESCVNHKGKPYDSATSVADAQKKADALNKKHGMKTLYS